MKRYITLLTIAVMSAAACEKKVEPVDAYTVTVDFKSTSAKALVGDVELNPKDSISLDFTVNSGIDLSYVEIQKNGVRIDTFRIPAGSSRKTFTGFKAYRSDSIPGDYSYRVVGRDSVARFLGDGNKVIKVTIKPDFEFYSYRILNAPDTTNKTNKCFYSLTTGNTYSYSNGAANSAMIDFGYYYDTTGASTTTIATDDFKHTFYALNATQPQLNFYDLSGFTTKNATIFKKMPNTVNFVSNLTSGGAINTLIRGNMTSGTSSKVNMLTPAAGNNVIGFRTASGRYGAILVRFTNQDSPAKETAIELDVKILKQ